MTVPPSGICDVYWRKNETIKSFVKDFKYTWDYPDTDLDYRFRLCYPVHGVEQCVRLSSGFKVVTDFDASIGINATAGTVQVVMHSKYSTKANCTSITQQPTVSPTHQVIITTKSPIGSDATTAGSSGEDSNLNQFLDEHDIN